MYAIEGERNGAPAAFKKCYVSVASGIVSGMVHI